MKEEVNGFKSFKLNDIDKLVAQNKVLIRQNAKLMHVVALLNNKIEFYKALQVENDYDKGFFKAFEIMQQILLSDITKGV